MWVCNFITIKNLTIIQLVFLFFLKFVKAFLTKSFSLLTHFYYCASLLKLSIRISATQYDRLYTKQDLIIITKFSRATIFRSIVLLCQRNTITTCSKNIHVLFKRSVAHNLTGWYSLVFIWFRDCFFEYHNSRFVLWSTLYKLKLLYIVIFKINYTNSLRLTVMNN